MLIDNCNKTLLEIDGLEERRRLSVPEINFRLILRQHILHLLDCKKAYWNKRCTFRYFKFGDGNTKFFHRVATERYRRNSTLDLESLNTGFIALIPKIQSLETVNDYRPITLLNCCLKILTKLLANRLQRVILKIIHRNQYGFLKGRSIQDCVAWAYEFIHQCQASGREIAISKLDFAKAFDTIEQAQMMEIMKCMGFDDRWLGWIKCLFSTAKSSVLLNGTPGKQFFCLRGVRQGDPLSPLIFVLVADLLQAAINAAYRAGDLQLPIPAQEEDYPVIQYADDTILVMPADESQAETIKSILQDYASLVGLCINFQKSTLITANIAADTTSRLAQVFGCSIGSMPFTYLGLPMGTARPTVAGLMPLVMSVEHKLSTAASLLDLGSKLTLVNSVVTSLAIYAMCSIRLPPKILDHLDKLRRYCLWAKNTDDGLKAVSMAAWDLVCRPKHKGGLGVLDLKIQNQGLLLKQLHKFYNRMDIPWVDLVWNTYYDGLVPHASGPCGSFWWKDVMNLAPTYRAITSVEVGDGSSTLFWKDAWHGDILADSHPRLFSFAKHDDISVRVLLTSPTLGQNFYLPLSVQARGELDDLQTSLASLELMEVNDAWHPVWGLEELASSKFYLHCFRDMEADDVFKWIWKAKCTNKWKVFAWLLLADRLDTRGLLKRKHMKLRDDNYACLLCHQPPKETVEHLFFHCVFSKTCWGKLGIAWPMHGNRAQLLHAAKNTWVGPMFMDVFIVSSWSIWKERNNKLFRSVAPTVDGWSQRFKMDFGMMRHRIKEALVPFVDQDPNTPVPNFKLTPGQSNMLTTFIGEEKWKYEKARQLKKAQYRKERFLKENVVNMTNDELVALQSEIKNLSDEFDRYYADRLGAKVRFVHMPSKEIIPFGEDFEIPSGSDEDVPSAVSSEQLDEDIEVDDIPSTTVVSSPVP
ncbi:uncharacterized protein [Aegilops tauschii subsp. strangulata]|uniref:uncharacterized protein n=1 Tax=Aegilops tauschii subsp. strangulata TaxID=200361 RepID=UPI003CC852E4